ncbi:MAG: PqqD family protein [bacterium]|nr:PqqD family protein [bacterium]
MAVLSLNAVCLPSEEVATREIEGEVIVVPLFSGPGGDDEEFYKLNDTARSIWLKLDGRRTLSEVASLVAEEFDVPVPELRNDLIEFIAEMTGRRLLTVREAG